MTYFPQVTILDAGRNALSFFLLLVVSLGLSVVRESLGPAMKRAKILAGLHFVFGGEEAHDHFSQFVSQPHQCSTLSDW
jgi:hypothetical protein